MKLLNAHGISDVILRAIQNDPYSPNDPDKGDITVTRLIAPPRKVALEAQYAKDLCEDASDRIFSLLGQALHVVLERAETKAITERRLTIERQGWVISGQLDRFVLSDGLLQDFKCTSTYAIKAGGRKEWEAQMNVLAAILREHGFTVNKLEIISILRDWHRSHADRSADYPISPEVRIDIPLWPEERCECYLDERIRLHQAARITLPECLPEERWAKPDTWALRKADRKTAVKVFPVYTDAVAALEAAGPQHSLEHRPGRDIRCESYCAGAPFCTQAHRILTGPGDTGNCNKEVIPCP